MFRSLRKFLAAALIAITAVTAAGTICAPAAEASERAVRIAFFPLNGFFMTDANGQRTGYGTDFLEALSLDSGIPIEFVPAESWTESMQLLNEGKVDLVAPAQHTPDRDLSYRFSTFPIGNEFGSLLTLSTNNNLIYEDYRRFNGMRVGCVPSIVFMDSYLNYLADHKFNTRMTYFKDTAAAVASLRAGEVDAILANLMVKSDSMKVLAKFGAAPFYLMTTISKGPLAERVDIAVRNFTSRYPGYLTDLARKYFAEQSIEPLTRQEMAFAAHSPTLNVGISGGVAPQSYLDDKGIVRGIDPSILDLVAQNARLTFRYVPLPKEGVTQEWLTENKISIVADVERVNNDHNPVNALLSIPYFETPKGFVGKKSRIYNLSDRYKVLLPVSYAFMMEGVEKLYPKFTFEYRSSMRECMDALADGKADLILYNRLVAQILLSKPQYEEFAILPLGSDTASYSLAVVSGNDTGLAGSAAREDSRALLTVLNKSIAMLNPEQVNDIIANETVVVSQEPSLYDEIYRYRWVLFFTVVLIAVIALSLVLIIHAQRVSHRAIAFSQRRLQNITNNINGGVIVLDPKEGLYVKYANTGFLDLLGCTKEQFEKEYHHSYLACVCDDDLPLIRSILENKDHEKEVSFEVRIRRMDGEFVRTLFNGTFGLNEEDAEELYCVVMDITEQDRIKEALLISKKRTDLVLEKSNDIIFEVNFKTRLISVSTRMRDRFGWFFPDRLKTGTAEELTNMWNVPMDSREKLLELNSEILLVRKDNHCDLRVCSENGDLTWCHLDLYPLCKSDGSMASVIGVIRDIDKEMLERIELQRQTQTDKLTGLWNKDAFSKLVVSYLNENKYSSSALIFLDLDNFKHVNDKLGHLRGDEAIVDAAKKLQIVFSNFDVISRFGGDEFCIFVKDIPEDTLRRKLDWTLEKLHNVYTDGVSTVEVSASIGIAMSLKHGTQYKELLELADQALYESKAAGRACYTFA